MCNKNRGLVANKETYFFRKRREEDADSKSRTGGTPLKFSIFQGLKVVQFTIGFALAIVTRNTNLLLSNIVRENK